MRQCQKYLTCGDIKAANLGYDGQSKGQGLETHVPIVIVGNYHSGTSVSY